MIPRGAALLDALSRVPFLERDAWIDQLLGFAPPPPDVDLPPGAVPYLPAGIAEIVAMVRDAPVRADDIVVDLGSGLGRVLIVTALLAGARGIGIEIQEHLVALSRERAAALGVDVSVVHGDAAEMTVDGSIYFLHAPFNGATLARVLERLATRPRPFVVCTVGVELHVPWLVARASSSVALAVYDARV